MSDMTFQIVGPHLHLSKFIMNACSIYHTTIPLIINAVGEEEGAFLNFIGFHHQFN